MVTGKGNKMDKNTYFTVHVSLLTFRFFKIISPRNPDLFKKTSYDFLFTDYCTSNVHIIFCSFLVSNLKKLSLVRALIFMIHIGIYRSNTGEKLVYYYS